MRLPMAALVFVLLAVLAAISLFITNVTTALPGARIDGRFLIAILMTIGSVLVVQAIIALPLNALLKLIRGNRSHLIGQDIPVWHTPSEIVEIARQVGAALQSLETAHEKNIGAARTDLADQFAKDNSEKFFEKVAQEVASKENLDAACQTFLGCLMDEFPTSIAFGMFFKLTKTVDCTAHAGLSEQTARSMSQLEPANPLIAAMKKSRGQTNVERRQFSNLGLNDMDFSRADRLCYIRLAETNDGELFVLVGVKGDAAATARIDRYLKGAVLSNAALMKVLLRFDHEYTLLRTDRLTDHPNRYALEEFVSARVGDPAEPYVVAAIEGDGFTSLNKSYGRKRMDKTIQELALKIKESVRMKLGPLEGTVNIFRGGACRFILVFERLHVDKTFECIDLIRSAVESTKAWRCGIPNWTISAGVALPVAGTKLAAAVEEAELTLDYIYDQSKSNTVLSARMLPKNFRRAAELTGDLQVLDLSAILQSLANSQKTGLLKITSQSRIFWMFMESGKPKRAAAGKLGGNNAIVECLSTFEEAQWEFQECVDMSVQQFEDLTRVPVSAIVNAGLESLLMDGALALDHLNSSRTAISNPDMFLMPLPAATKASVWTSLTSGQDPISEQEKEMMELVIDEIGKGSLTFTALLAKLNDRPTFLVWRATALLLTHRMVKFSRLRMSSTH